MADEPDPAIPEENPDEAYVSSASRPAPSLWDSVKVLLLYGACIGGLFGLRYIPAVEQYVVEPYTGFVAASAEFLISAVGTEITRDGLTISGPRFSLVIMEECNGVAALLIFLAAVLAHPVGIRAKLFGILLGIPAIYAFNEIRVISLFYLRWHWPVMFDIMHLYVWQALVILFAIVTWLFWAGICGPTKSTPEEAAAV